VRGRLEVLLVKGRKSQRWGLPAGWALRGRPLARTAAREAREEGGVRGTVANQVLTVVRKRKRYRLAGEIEWQMAVYPLRVDSMSDDYPEADERKRGWFSPDDAAKLVHPSSLGPVLQSLARGR
jgi:ADP-ribose pyrophosphatase YjhB (NUDIX family)